MAAAAAAEAAVDSPQPPPQPRQPPPAPPPRQRDPYAHPSRGEMGKLLNCRLPTPPIPTRKMMLARRRRDRSAEAALFPCAERFVPSIPCFQIRPTTQRRPCTHESPLPEPPHTARPLSLASSGESLPHVHRRVPRRLPVEMAWRVTTVLRPDGPPPLSTDRPWRVVKRDRWQDLMLQRILEHDPDRCAYRDQLESRQGLYSSFSTDGIFSPHKSKCNRNLYNAPDQSPKSMPISERPKWYSSSQPPRSPREPQVACGPHPRVLNTRMRQMAASVRSSDTPRSAA
eukprot:TRINITY_DN15632_c0_g1_i1.p2 TRINITY_DN15632_c0_g1~~TRINITY_DN15632_c0_g1_i1.p2  ORF type:complete len:309 (+),score=77.31 TRINITY_DN15632_c0_g1_i1:73-927(+)